MRERLATRSSVGRSPEGWGEHTSQLSEFQGSQDIAKWNAISSIGEQHGHIVHQGPNDDHKPDFQPLGRDLEAPERVVVLFIQLGGIPVRVFIAATHTTAHTGTRDVALKVEHEEGDDGREPGEAEEQRQQGPWYTAP